MGLPTVFLGAETVDDLDRLFPGVPTVDGPDTSCENELLEESNVPPARLD